MTVRRKPGGGMQVEMQPPTFLSKMFPRNGSLGPPGGADPSVSQNFRNSRPNLISSDMIWFAETLRKMFVISFALILQSVQLAHVDILNNSNNLYTSPNIRMIKSGKIRLARHVSHMRKTRTAYKVLIWQPKGKGEQARYRCEGNTDMRLKEIGLEGRAIA
jgi:hypothetical protein